MSLLFLTGDKCLPVYQVLYMLGDAFSSNTSSTYLPKSHYRNKIVSCSAISIPVAIQPLQYQFTFMAKIPISIPNSAQVDSIRVYRDWNVFLSLQHSHLFLDVGIPSPLVTSNRLHWIQQIDTDVAISYIGHHLYHLLVSHWFHDRLVGCIDGTVCWSNNIHYDNVLKTSTFRLDSSRPR